MQLINRHKSASSMQQNVERSGKALTMMARQGGWNQRCVWLQEELKPERFSHSLVRNRMEEEG